MKNIEIKKYVIPNLPYVMMFWIFSKIAESYRLSAGADVVTKAMAAISDLGTAITQNPLPSFHPRDLLFGIAGAAAFRLPSACPLKFEARFDIVKAPRKR